jgi:UDPglucose 6-dehydrogenase
MLIGIIGHGVVGQAIEQAFLTQSHQIKWYDKFKNDSSPLSDLLDCECIFVCVPTNTIDNACDILQVKETIAQLSNLSYSGVIVIKSTVIPGTTKMLIDQYSDLRINFVPEFLHQDRALYDFLHATNKLIIGSESDLDFEFIAKLHDPFCQGAVKISTTEAELVKYFSNNYNSLRIVFANAYYEVCQQLGADYNNVLSSAASISTISSDQYLKCNKDLRGFEGKCLPKDIEAFNTFIKQLNLPITLFDAVINDNSRYIQS